MKDVNHSLQGKTCLITGATNGIGQPRHPFRDRNKEDRRLELTNRRGQFEFTEGYGWEGDSFAAEEGLGRVLVKTR